jgi:hypothetical protein
MASVVVWGYVSSYTLFDTVGFVYEEKLWNRNQFKAISFLNNFVVKLILYVIILILYPIIAAGVYFFGNFSGIANVGVKVTSQEHRGEVLTATTLNSGIHSGKLGAQQHYWSLGLDEGFITSTFGPSDNTNH